MPPEQPVIVHQPVGFLPGPPELHIARMPSYAELSVAINELVTTRDGEWSGVPMPLPGMGLVLEDRHPWAAKIAEIQEILDEGHKPDAVRECSSDDLDFRLVNKWRKLSGSVTGEIVILRHPDGRTKWGIVPDKPARNRMLFGPFDTMDAWNLDTELKAIDSLSELLSARMFKSYILTGGFLEGSKRSGLHYFFRRCRPTIAMTPHRPDGEMRILACLCLHPIGYYAGTFGGAMTPTDDVIAHLLLLRGDEHLYWKRSNQHPPLAPESGL